MAVGAILMIAKMTECRILLRKTLGAPKENAKPTRYNERQTHETAKTSKSNGNCGENKETQFLRFEVLGQEGEALKDHRTDIVKL